MDCHCADEFTCGYHLEIEPLATECFCNWTGPQEEKLKPKQDRQVNKRGNWLLYASLNGKKHIATNNVISHISVQVSLGTGVIHFAPSSSCFIVQFHFCYSRTAELLAVRNFGCCCKFNYSFILSFDMPVE